MNSVMKKVTFIDRPSETNYGKYREYLRKSFEYSCAYCTITESESPGATFNIDHFRPVTYFPQLKNECDNLRYSCPRCNSYKRDKWISELKGCIRECENCNTKICTTDILRFINNVVEEPKKMLSLDENGLLFAVNGSKPAEYTIKYLRLNRNQLIKLRSVRRSLILWKEELIKLKSEAEEQVNSFQNKLEDYKKSNSNSKLKGAELLLHQLAVNQFEILILTSQHHVDFIDDQINRLEIMMKNRIGDDERFI